MFLEEQISILLWFLKIISDDHTHTHTLSHTHTHTHSHTHTHTHTHSHTHHTHTHTHTHTHWNPMTRAAHARQTDRWLTDWISLMVCVCEWVCVCVCVCVCACECTRKREERGKTTKDWERKKNRFHNFSWSSVTRSWSKPHKVQACSCVRPIPREITEHKLTPRLRSET